MTGPNALLECLVASPCSNPEMDLDSVLAAYSQLGYRKFEVFTSWVQSRFDIDREPGYYLEKGRQYGMRFVSLHLPVIKGDDDRTLQRAIRGARFAQAIGARTVLYKADRRESYVRAARPFLDAIEGLALTPVVQNHFGTALTTLDDVREVLEGIADPRMKVLLEVGHFHSAQVSWKDACGYLGGRVALVHIKDQLGRQSVPFGTGEIDLPGLFSHLRASGYTGDFVVEMEVTDKQNTLKYLADAREYAGMFCAED